MPHAGGRGVLSRDARATHLARRRSFHRETRRRSRTRLSGLSVWRGGGKATSLFARGFGKRSTLRSKCRLDDFRVGFMYKDERLSRGACEAYRCVSRRKTLSACHAEAIERSRGDLVLRGGGLLGSLPLLDRGGVRVDVLRVFRGGLRGFPGRLNLLVGSLLPDDRKGLLHAGGLVALDLVHAAGVLDVLEDPGREAAEVLRARRGVRGQRGKTNAFSNRVERRVFPRDARERTRRARIEERAEMENVPATSSPWCCPRRRSS